MSLHWRHVGDGGTAVVIGSLQVLVEGSGCFVRSHGNSLQFSLSEREAQNGSGQEGLLFRKTACRVSRPFRGAFPHKCNCSFVSVTRFNNFTIKTVFGPLNFCEF